MIKDALLKLTFIISVVAFISCGSSLKSTQVNQKNNNNTSTNVVNNVIVPGADQFALYLPQLKGKKVGIMGNQTSIVGADKKHLVDVLIDNKVDLKFAFAPEHGFRGNVERGEKFGNDVDQKTGLPLFTLYGGNKKQDSIIRKSPG